MDLTNFLTVVLAALGGLTVLAYRHPDAYQKIDTKLVLGLGGLMILGVVWNYALELARAATMDLVPTENWKASHDRIEELKFLLPVHMICLVAAILYLIFLSKLPNMLASKKNREDGIEDKGRE